MERIKIIRCKKASPADLTQCVVEVDGRLCDYITRLPANRYGAARWLIRNDPERRRFVTKEDAARAVLAHQDTITDASR